MRFAHSASDELGDLRAEIENENFVVLHAEIELSFRNEKGGSVAALEIRAFCSELQRILRAVCRAQTGIKPPPE
jgi:hypothetical protein